MEFSILKPKTIEEAVRILHTTPKTKVIAGGTDVVIQLRNGIEYRQLVDVSALLDAAIEEEGENIRIGAMATHSDVIDSELIKRWAGVLAEACSSVAAPQIRNLGTIAGNIGNASPAGDSLPALLVLGAVIEYRDEESAKSMALDDFFVGPGRTKLAGKGIITALKIPKIREKGTKFLKIGKRNALAISVCNCASYVELDVENRIKAVKIALGSVAPTPVRVRRTEQFLLGRVPEEDLFSQAGEMAKDEVNPITDIRSTADYRKDVVAVLVKRTFREAVLQANLLKR
ncbi:FAD binding domain-containing protein [Candidatus Formimonas warabiya]|uniref:FAD binding domain-containing protein n=1 Tax=Formimonas warabiya TaxID=1761012 RepID=UPI001BE42C3F|nr:xanthine dehydrogenase family protein subunit M [Candidatus Formimonas warabiya]